MPPNAEDTKPRKSIFRELIDWGVFGDGTGDPVTLFFRYDGKTFTAEFRYGVGIIWRPEVPARSSPTRWIDDVLWHYNRERYPDRAEAEMPKTRVRGTNIKVALPGSATAVGLMELWRQHKTKNAPEPGTEDVTKATATSRGRKRKRQPDGKSNRTDRAERKKENALYYDVKRECFVYEDEWQAVAQSKMRNLLSAVPQTGPNRWPAYVNALEIGKLLEQTTV